MYLFIYSNPSGEQLVMNVEYNQLDTLLKSTGAPIYARAYLYAYAYMFSFYAYLCIFSSIVSPLARCS